MVILWQANRSCWRWCVQVISLDCCNIYICLWGKKSLVMTLGDIQRRLNIRFLLKIFNQVSVSWYSLQATATQESGRGLSHLLHCCGSVGSSIQDWLNYIWAVVSGWWGGARWNIIGNPRLPCSCSTSQQTASSSGKLISCCHWGKYHMPRQFRQHARLLLLKLWLLRWMRKSNICLAVTLCYLLRNNKRLRERGGCCLRHFQYLARCNRPGEVLRHI